MNTEGKDLTLNKMAAYAAQKVILRCEDAKETGHLGKIFGPSSRAALQHVATEADPGSASVSMDG